MATPEHRSANVTPLPTAADVRQKSGDAPRKPRDSDIPEAVWDAIEGDYRSGLSYGKLSEIYDVPVSLIVKRKQKEGWTRDLTHEVQAETMARLAVGTDCDPSKIADESAVIDAAARHGVEVVTRHRTALGAHITALGTVAEAIKRVVDAVQAGKEPRAQDLALLPKGAVSASGYILQQLGNAFARVVPLERRAYGLDAGEQERPYEDHLRAFAATREQRQADGASQQEAA